jgi:hypothetical protein
MAHAGTGDISAAAIRVAQVRDTEDQEQQRRDYDTGAEQASDK